MLLNAFIIRNCTEIFLTLASHVGISEMWLHAHYLLYYPVKLLLLLLQAMALPGLRTSKWRRTGPQRSGKSATAVCSTASPLEKAPLNIAVSAYLVHILCCAPQMLTTAQSCIQ